VDSMGIKLNNLSDNHYQTGKYKIITYQYEGRKEAMLVIECKNTIATVVLSTTGDAEFKEYLPAFIETIKTVKVWVQRLK
jgi:hypothetical protein